VIIPIGKEVQLVAAIEFVEGPHEISGVPLNAARLARCQRQQIQSNTHSVGFPMRPGIRWE
jgi:hypothetical protein